MPLSILRNNLVFFNRKGMKAFSAVTKVGGVAFMPLSIDFPRIKVPVVEHVNARNSARLGDACRILLPHLFSPTSLQNGLKDLDPKKVAALVCKSFFFLIYLLF